MFSFLDMIGTYEQRAVRRDEKEKFTLDTAMVTDREWVYETAVAHEDFNNGEWIILEGAMTKQDAEAVHDKWLEKISGGVTELEDIFDGYVHTSHAR